MSKPILYLKNSCPFCLKLRIFLSEAGLAEGFAFETFDDGDDRHKALRGRFEADGREPSFPALEAGNSLETGTDDLIARFAGDAGVDASRLPLLAYYSEGLFKRVGELFLENRALKAKLAE
ncbi:hypothetical protein [Novosphingobium sp. BL-52-GroH]|uniref:hypothetical protein n=1 Tax=Novosphingobium sp. BL-52-GroH TaxID=3349877 RepID=UPI00384D775B